MESAEGVGSGDLAVAEDGPAAVCLLSPRISVTPITSRRST